MTSRWKTYLLYGCLSLFGGLFVFLTYKTYNANNMGFQTKTYWDWMELLIIPLFLAGGVFYLNWSERKTEREIAKDRQQEMALQEYLDRMFELLLKENLLNTDRPEVAEVARIRTLSVLRNINAKRKVEVIRFLYESRLIDIKGTIVNLLGADLSYAPFIGVAIKDGNLSGVNLQNANLQHAYLPGVNLADANLESVNLGNAYLKGTKLNRANLRNANLNNCDLSQADLNFANLEKTNMKNAQTWETNFIGARMPDGSIHE